MSLSKITLKYDVNYNNKLYCKFFSCLVRTVDNVKVDSLCEVSLSGKIIGVCKVLKCERKRFNEIETYDIQRMFGVSYDNCLQLLWNKGFNVKIFDLEVDYIELEMVQYYPKLQTS